MLMPKIEKFTISRNDCIMEGWPDMIRLHSGKILVFYNECEAHNNRDHSRITMRKSCDNGITWSEKQYIGEETFHGEQWNSIRVNQLKNGKILLVCDKVCENELSGKTKLYLWESTDDGNSWSEKVDIGVYGYCSDKVRELNDGTLLLCISVYNPDTAKTEIHAHKSCDGGKNWSEGVVVAESNEYTFIEPAALELKYGKIAVFIRENSLKGYNGFIAFSYDKGTTFENLQEIPIKGMHRPFVGYLANGKILLSYREHLSSTLKYPNLKACVFEEGELFSPQNMKTETFLIDHDNGAEKADQGYSAWVQLPDKTLLMANYIVDDAPKAYIRGYRIKL